MQNRGIDPPFGRLHKMAGTGYYDIGVIFYRLKKISTFEKGSKGQK